MNLMLFEQPFEVTTLPAESAQARHIGKVLRAEIGTLLFIGFVNGLRARAEVVELPDDGSVVLKVVSAEAAPDLLPISLLIGLPRPHTAKRILFEAASMGVSSLHFFESERSEPSYAQSSLWSTSEWRERLLLGVEQSFGTYLPEVAMHADLQSVLSAHYDRDCKVCLDNYEAGVALSGAVSATATSAAIALGSERGWSADERDVFRKNGWTLAHLGAQVLRVETAAVAATATVAGQLGAWAKQTSTQL